MLQGEYSRFLRELGAKLHFAAHSHHPWPNRSRDAQLAYWDDSAKHFDAKWAHLFSEVVPEVQAAIAGALSLQDPSRITFAPNTHELVTRLLSALPHGAKVLATDSEFYSFDRQSRRLAEDGSVVVTRVATEPFETLEDRLIEGINTTAPDLVFVSHVFFNSGVVLGRIADLVSVAMRANPTAVFVLDGYHGFCAIPTDLSQLEGKIFYVAGGYKYAQSGEGACFMVCADREDLRPKNTGWFSDLEHLSANPSSEVTYGERGARFRGATMDFTALYRMRAVLPWLVGEVGIDRIHSHVQALEVRFLEQLASHGGPIGVPDLVPPEDPARFGHFLTFESGDAAGLVETLGDRGIIIDHRGARVRIGFGAYHTARDVDALVAQLSSMGGAQRSLGRGRG